jgi:hypothetical protein
VEKDSRDCRNRRSEAGKKKPKKTWTGKWRNATEKVRDDD